MPRAYVRRAPRVRDNACAATRLAAERDHLTCPRCAAPATSLCRCPQRHAACVRCGTFWVMPEGRAGAAAKRVVDGDGVTYTGHRLVFWLCDRKRGKYGRRKAAERGREAVAP